MPPQLNLLQINSQFNPGEGPVLFTVTIPWGTLAAAGYNPANVYSVNAQQQAQSGRFSRCQAIFVNNTASPYSLSILCNETGQSISIPPFTQGVYPLYCAANPSFVITQNQDFTVFQGAPLIVTTSFLAFLNVPVLPWQQNQLPYQQSGYGGSTTILFAGNNWGTGNSIIPPVPPDNLMVLYSISCDFFQTGLASNNASASFQLYEGNGASKLIAQCNVPWYSSSDGLVHSWGFTWGPGGYIFQNPGFSLMGAFNSAGASVNEIVITTYSYSLVHVS